jgi:hypothetical protein
MRKVMKRSDQSRKEIDFESSHRKELEELQLQRQGRLANRWLKERFGERGEGSGRSIQEEGISEEMDERVRIDATTEEEYSVRTPEEVVENQNLQHQKMFILHQEINVQHCK